MNKTVLELWCRQAAQMQSSTLPCKIDSGYAHKVVDESCHVTLLSLTFVWWGQDAQL